MKAMTNGILILSEIVATRLEMKSVILTRLDERMIDFLFLRMHNQAT